MRLAEHSSRFRSVVAVTLILTTLASFANVDPKKGRVTANPTSGNRYSLEQEVEYGQQAIPEIQKELPLLPVDHPVSKYIKALATGWPRRRPATSFPMRFGS
jgi:hypothetical protein